jgi:hypothetical protein
LIEAKLIIEYKSFQQQLMNKGCSQPHPKACKKNDGQRKMFFETKKGHQKKKKGGKNPKESPFGERLHDGGVAAVFKIHEDHRQRAGQRHDRHQPAGGRQLFTDGSGNKDDGDAENHFKQDLHQWRSMMVEFLYTKRVKFRVIKINNNSRQLKSSAR